MTKPFTFVLRNAKGSVHRLIGICTTYPMMTRATAAEFQFNAEADEEAVIRWFAEDGSDLLWYSLLGADGEPEDERGEDEKDTVASFYCVSIYKMDRAYGGHEEGGWWYTYYEPEHEFAHLTKCFQEHAEARAYAEVLEAYCGKLNEGRPSIGSMASIGQFVVMVDAGAYPHHQPKQRPVYE
jgi:hypothetical protein